MPLSEIRKEIDKIDNELVDLLVRRLEVSRKVAEIKQENNIPILNKQREDEILLAINNKSDTYGNYLKNIYSMIFETSRQLQHTVLKNNNSFIHFLEKIKNNSETEKDTVVCQGIKGSYSDIAAQKMFSYNETIFCKNFEDVFSIVSKNEKSVGVIPIENSNAGLVFETLDLLRKYDLTIFKVGDLSIKHCLLGIDTATQEDITEVYSHKQALMQCSDFLKNICIKPIDCENTAFAAKKIANIRKKNIGCIASYEASQSFGLKVLNNNITNSFNNKTRFIAVTKNNVISQDADKISISFSLEHKTGSLYKMLNKFALCGLNLTSIQSRPIKDSEFEYYFYIDFKGNIREDSTIYTLCSIYDEVCDFAFLGNYNEYNI